jgi:hypothetical protein
MLDRKADTRTQILLARKVSPGFSPSLSLYIETVYAHDKACADVIVETLLAYCLFAPPCPLEIP